MTPTEFYKRLRQVLDNDGPTLAPAVEDPEFEPLARLIDTLLEENRTLRQDHRVAVDYIREKINQMLTVIGTVPLRPEELDEKHLIALDPLGIISQSFSQVLDNTRRTNTKLTLARNEIQAIFDSVGGGLLVLDRDRRILSCNSLFREMFSPPGKHIVGKTCYEIVCGREDSPRELCSFKKMMESGCSASMPDWHHGGRHLRVVATPIKDDSGQINRCVLLYVDITELVEARFALDDERERLAITLESIADGVIATDAEGRVTLMNTMAETLTGWTSSAALGRKICTVMEVETEAGGPQSCSTFFEEIMMDRTPQGQRIDNATLVEKSGLKRSIYLSAAPIHKHDHAVAGTIVVFRDITREKRLEEEITKATRLESLGVFAGGIAHDFNNLLTGVLGNISLAMALLEPGSDVHNLLKETEKSTYRSKSLTQQLLTFATGGDPVKKVVSTPALIRESAEFSLRGANVRCVFHLAEDLLPIEADEGQINQVVQNLVINAAQAMAMGGVITITAENLAVTGNENLPLSPGDYIRVAFADHGEGIPEKYLDKIFDPFFTTKSAGSGLGLSTSYSIASKHHGLLTVDSSPGAGATFFLYLPASERELPVAAQKSVIGVSCPGKVLVMDDEELIRTVCRAMLEFGGYEVEVAVDGRETIEKYTQAMADGRPFDVVLMDLTIPGGMGGGEAVGELRRIDPRIKAIVSSGYANDPIMADYSRYGFSRVIPKPYELDELLAVLAETIAAPK